MKPDAAQISELITGLPRQPWIAGTNRARWPLHLFRIDDVRAAASILNKGVIYSRERAAEYKVFGHDSASPSVMEHSPDRVRKFVRLYFRPRTPTEYRSEGFRPKDAIELGAHRPMPVVLVFDSLPILTADHTIFTNGNAGRGECREGTTVDFLRGLPFDRIYHDGPLSENEKDRTIFHRCAEVWVPDELKLDNLRHVLCRSNAEHETLRSLLTPEARTAHEKKIGVSARVHYKHWTFLEGVDLTSERMTFRFSPYSRTPGPFHATSEILDAQGRIIGTWENKTFHTRGAHSLTLKNIGNPKAYGVTLSLDGSLAFMGEFKAREALL